MTLNPKNHIMLLIILFSGYAILITLLLLSPIVYYIVKADQQPSLTPPAPTAENPRDLEDLAPVDDANQSEEYFNTLKWALANPKIKNIAITGPYGSGKSSILKTFQQKYPTDFSFLDISLASFVDENSILPNQDDGDGGNSGDSTPPSNGSAIIKNRKKNETQQLIELSVLQQIFYRVDQSAIPSSRFKRISVISQSNKERYVIGIVALLIGILNLVFPNIFQQFSPIKDFKNAFAELFFVINLLLILPASLWLISFMIDLTSNVGLKKLNISSGEIEIDPKTDTSILNKYLDELVYFFSVTTFNVLVIEDMDRFNDPEIFTKLRELNTLLNSSTQINRRIVFIYAIRDDLFQDEKTRTKFFDYIIPIIPVINWSNSRQKLVDKLAAQNMKIDQRFITSITLYIDDMRLLKNIFNELMLYKATLRIPKERQTKLLAMIVYKNMYPVDFSDLHNGKGLVFEAFDKVEAVRQTHVVKLSELIKVKQEEIRLANESFTESMEQLRAPYVLAVADKCPGFYYFTQDSERIPFQKTMEDPFFEKIKTGKNITYYRGNYGESKISLTFSDIETTVAPNESYLEREKRLEQKLEHGKRELSTEIESLMREVRQTESMRLSAMLSKQPDEFPDLNDDHKPNRLLRYLLLNRYIDESYPYLISYFYPGKIGRADMHFITNLNDRRELPFSYTLEKVEGLIEMLELPDFEQEGILNLTVIDQLLKSNKKYSHHLARVSSLFNSRSKRAIKFIDAYLRNGHQIKNFTDFLSQYWPEVFDYFQANKLDVKLLLRAILTTANSKDLLKFNATGMLKIYIEENYSIVKGHLSGDLVRAETVLKQLNIKFKNSRSPNKPSTDPFFELICGRNFYLLNKDNIVEVLYHNVNIAKRDSREAKCGFTFVQNSKCPELIAYIKTDLSDFVENVMLSSNEDLNDNEKDIYALLNNERQLTPGQRLGILTREKTILNELSEINDEAIQQAALAENKVLPVWPNILTWYQNKKSVDDVLIRYFNDANNARSLGAKLLTTATKFYSDVRDDLENEIIYCESIRDENYADLVKSFKNEDTDFDFDLVGQGKWEILIDQGLISLSIENFDKLTKVHQGLRIRLVAKQIQTYLKTPDDFNIDAADRLSLLNDNSIDMLYRLKLISIFTNAQIGATHELANKVLDILVETAKLSMDEERLKTLIKKATNVNRKLILFTHHLAALSPEIVRPLLNDLGGKYAQLNSRDRPWFPLNDLNRFIAEQLEIKQIIAGKKIDETKNEIRMSGRPVS